MPDNVLFGAELDTAGMKKGTAEVVANLEAIKAANQELIEQEEILKETNVQLAASNDALKKSSEALKETNKNLGKSNKELEKDYQTAAKNVQNLEKEQAKIVQTSKKSQAEHRALGKEIKNLQNEQAALGAKINQNNAAIDQNTAKVKTNKVEIENNTKAIKANGDTMKANSATIATNNKAIASTEKELVKAEQASGKFAAGVGKAYGGLRVLANIIPGLGISGIFLLGYEAIVAMVEGLDLFSSKLSDIQKQQQLTSEITINAASAYGKEKAELDILVASIQREGVGRKEKFALLEELQKKYPGYFDNIKTETDLTNKLAEAYENASKGILLKASSNAAEGLLTKNIEERLKLETKFNDQERKLGLDRAQALKNEAANFGAGSPRIKLLKDELDRYQKIRSENFGKEVVDLDKQSKFLLDKILNFNKEIVELGGTNPLLDTKKDKAAKGPENVFKEKLAEFRARLAAAQLGEFQSEPLIQNKFAEQLNKEFEAINKLLKEKKLTGAQADFLKAMLRQINDLDLSKSLDEFREKQKAAIDKINDQLIQLSFESANKRVANIRDEFERDKEAIDISYTQTIEQLNKKLVDLRDNIDKEAKKGLVSPEVVRQKKTALGLIFGDLFTQAEIDKANKQLELAFKTFQNTIKESQRFAEENTLLVDESTANKIGALTEALLRGTIGQKKYQAELTRITKEGAAARRIIRLQELRDELKLVNDQLANTSDPTIKKKLEDQQRQIRAAIAALRNEINTDAGNDKGKIPPFIQNIIDYGNALNGLFGQIASFWQQVNATEQAALNRSIALQQRRVDNAREIADKGNAEYLEMEQKRLDELERKREENARKQLAINNALTLSQALVATISAIAQAASTGNPLLAIAALGSVIAAIGAGYAFVNSLQPQSESFYSGVESVSGDGRPRGKDTIPARLNIGERVVTTQKNTEYWDTLHAVHNGSVPSNVLNAFVNSYPQASFPSIDYSKLEQATSNKMGSDSYEVSKRLQETNEKLEMVIEAISGVGVNVKMDEAGFSASISQYLKNKSLRNKA